MGDVNPDINLKSIFVRKIIAIGLIIYLFLIFIITFVGYIILFKTYSDIYTKYEYSLNTGKYEYNNEMDICHILDCFKYKTTYEDRTEYTIIENGEGYRTTINRFGAHNILYKNITTDLNIVVRVQGTEYFVNNNNIENGLYNTFIVIAPILLILFTIIYVPLYISIIRKKLIEKGEYKSELESKLARDLTEMLHHEMGAPLGLVKTQTDELLINLYPKDFSDIKYGKDISIIKDKSEKDKLNIELFRSLYLGIDRLQAILNLISGAKHIRFSNGTVPISNIIVNIASSVNSFKLKKILVVGGDSKLFKEYSVIHEYGNGNMLNALHVLFNNAMEASADMIQLECKLHPDNNNKLLMEILIKDNGIGILDKYGNPDKSNRIFKYGYTTKGNDTSERFIIKLLKLLGFNLIDVNEPKRGIGLYLTKRLLKEVGGDLSVYDTNSNGTTFKLVVPVRKTIYS